MLKNYFIVAVRNLFRNKIISTINLVGLSVSIAFCLSLIFYIRFEQSFDSFHSKKDRLFRLEMSSQSDRPDVAPKKHIFSFLTKNEDQNNQLVFPVVVSSDMKQTFPEIRSITRMKDEGTQLVKVKNEVFSEEHTLYVDNNFFNNPFTK